MAKLRFVALGSWGKIAIMRHNHQVGAMILIVDDDMQTGASLERLLRVVGYNAVAVPNGMEALALMAVRRPDLIVVDLHMPKSMSGTMLICSIRSDSSFASVPIWVYTADFSQAQEQEARRCGAQEYLIKGTIGYSALAARVEALLGTPRP